MRGARVTRWAAAVALVLLSVGVDLASGGIARAAVIDGRVVHPERPEAGADIDVRLLGVNRAGETHTDRTRSGPDGRFRFDDLPAPAAYLIAADYLGLSFSGGSIVFEEGSEGATRSSVIHVYERSDDAAELAIQSLEWVLEREAGIYRVRMLARIENPTLRAVALEPDASPALRLGLLPGHTSLETPFAFGNALPSGTKLVGDALELRGPFFPGTRDLHFVYDVPRAVGPLEVELPVPDRVGLLDLRVRDFGVVVEAGLLHPARPGRDGDQVYLRYLGFDLAAGTPIPLSIEPLPPRSAPPRPVQAVLVALLAGGIMFWVLRPLRGGQPALLETREEDGERAALFSALADLEHDFETGKLSTADRDRLRAELRSEALRSLARPPASPARTPSAGGRALAPSAACDCGHVLQPGDRFCAHCGKPL